jgi:hypothetical protein
MPMSRGLASPDKFWPKIAGFLAEDNRFCALTSAISVSEKRENERGPNQMTNRIRNTLFAAAAIITASPALAGEVKNTYDEFNGYYDSVMQEAQKQGVEPQRHCFPGYCASSVVIHGTNNTVIFASNRRLSDGTNEKEFCNGTNFTRRCWYSDGRIVDETSYNTGWTVTNTVATSFSD